jgi:hypothetical protein
METAKYSDIVGVFRDRAKADQALEALRQTGMGSNLAPLTVYNPHAEEEAADFTRLESDTRFIVHVWAEGREQEAVEILMNCGANNADLPPGTALVHGVIVASDEAPVDLLPANPVAGASSDSLFEGPIVPDRLNDLSTLDDPHL